MQALPFLFFICALVTPAVIWGDFYAMPVLLVFVLTAAFCFLVYRKNGTEANLSSFCRAAGDSDIILMLVIFLLAGGFSEICQQIGSVKALVNLCLQLCPLQYTTAALFGTCCLISFASGSSMGTILALAPIASALAVDANVSHPLVLGAVVGGAIFGDNLSLISDTTIAAVRSQQANDMEKFKTNAKISLPAALLVMLFYILIASDLESCTDRPSQPIDPLLILPYALVVIGAMMRLNVLIVLFLGTLTAVLLAANGSTMTGLEIVGAVRSGMVEVLELMMISMIAAGISGLIRERGGFNVVMTQIAKRVSSVRSGQQSIALLSLVVNAFTANNTVAIIVCGPITKQIGEMFRIKAHHRACLMDAFCSACQGLLPYGAQILGAAKWGGAGATPLLIIQHSYYPMALFSFSIAATFFLDRKSGE